MGQGYRIEADSMGEMQVPVEAYYGAQTARAVENFPISGLRFPRAFIRALGLIKKHAAATNAELGLLAFELAGPIEEAAAEVVGGRWDDQFVVDIFQTGSGTSTNMNANEVIAHRANELITGAHGSGPVHANDHVNRGQSSNDVIPSALHIAAFEEIARKLGPSLQALAAGLRAKCDEYNPILKIGRTHLQDATPIRLGQEFSGYKAQVEMGLERLRSCEPRLGQLALGGTAVGTGINTHPEFPRRTIARIASETGLAFRETENHFAAQGAIDTCVEVSAGLKTLAVALIKIANDIRWLASGPRCGLGELRLPATQPGSSIMPGKVNPVMCEMLIQVCAEVIGHDAAITLCGIGGYLELNTMLPLTAYNLLDSINLLANATGVFTHRCVNGIEADRAKCEGNIEQSLAMCTALAPVIGYDRAAEIAKQAYATGKTVREIACEMKLLEEEKIVHLLDPLHQV